MTATREEPLRILMVSARFSPFVGGTEIHTGVVAAELVRRGHDVTVATTDLSGQLATTEDLDGVRVVRTRAWPRRSDLYLAPGLAPVIGEGDWDLVHVQGYHTAVAPLALSVARRRGIPTALTFHSGGHSSVARNALRPLHTRALRRLILGVDLLIGVSEFEADLFARRLGIDAERIEIIPNGVPEFKPTLTDGDDAALTPVPDTRAPEPVSADRARLRVVAGGPTILSLGRLVRYKGHHRVIRALPHLLAVDPTIRLVILGRGPYRRRLERLVTRLDLDEHVTFDFVPSHERPRLHEIMTNASLAILLSNYESHGMAAHEALSAGLPLIVLDRTALSDLVSAGVAQAVPPSATDREVASIVLRTLSAAGEESSAISSPTLARIQHSWPTIVDRLESAYRRVLGRPATSAGDGGTALGTADR